MRKTIMPYSFGIIVISVLFLSACGKAASVSPSVGVLSDVGMAGIAREQKNGYDAGFKVADIPFAYKSIDEGAPQSDTQRLVRDMVQDPQSPLIAMLGGTSNDATSHAAALVNFFNVPMLIPSANGDNLFPSNNLWAFRLSAPGTDYAKYLFDNFLTKSAMDALTAPDPDSILPAPELKIAILYEQNTFGESAAVATATAAMAQSINIRVYSNFKPVNSDPESLKLLANKVKDERVQLIYLVSSDPALAKNLVQTMRTIFDTQSMPILIGQAEGFAAQDFIASPESEGIYVLRQQIDRANCPATIQSSYDAQSYAAVYLLDQAMQEASDNLAGAGIKFSFTSQKGPTILQQREAIRDALKTTNLNVPCLGMVAFDNTGQNKLLKLELVRITNGKAVTTLAADFLDVLKKRLENDLLQ